MSNEKLNPAFIPVSGPNSLIQAQVAAGGELYFTTDTQKIYLGMENGTKKLMGYDNGIFYGKKEIPVDLTGGAIDPIVNFYSHDIEQGSTRMPIPGDLILNIDGCFYRVKQVLNKDLVKTERVTLQGTGGGGGNASGPSTGGGNFQIMPVNSRYYFSTEATEAKIEFRAIGPVDNWVTRVRVAYDENMNSVFYERNGLSWPFEQNHAVNIVNEIPKFAARPTMDDFTIYLRIEDRRGNFVQTPYTIKMISLSLTKTMNELFSISGNTFPYRCDVGGSQIQGLERNIVYKFIAANGNEVSGVGGRLNLLPTAFGQQTKNLENLESLGHGVYTLQVQIEGSMSGAPVTSNIITHKVLRSTTGNALFTANVPEQYQQYTDLDIHYLLAYGEVNKEYNMKIYVDDMTKPYTTEIITSNVASTYKISFDKIKTYFLKFVIEDLGVEQSSSILITQYDGLLPVIDTARDDLELYLNAKGNTNTAVDKNRWYDSKNDTRYADLSDFYFKHINGWLTDDDGINYLKVSQGAHVVFDDYSPLDGQPLVTGLTIEMDVRISGITDYDEYVLDCLSYNNRGEIKSGFCIQGNVFKAYQSGKEWFNMNLVEDKRVRISFVIESCDLNDDTETFPFYKVYLDGILSLANSYEESGTDFTNAPEDKAYLNFRSTGGQIDVYSVRMYSSALAGSVVLNNYQASLNTLEEREYSYALNNVRGNKGENEEEGPIDLAKIESATYDLKIPYMKITGGYACDKKFKMDSRGGSNTQALPTGKKDYRLIDVEVHYPKYVPEVRDGNNKIITPEKNSYFNGYNDFSIKCTFDNPDLTVLTGFDNTPNTGAMMYAQGTSSMEYPVKNLRIKFKGSKFKVRPTLKPVELICMKADFMESSGSHNTGGGNFVDDAYKKISIQTPGQAHFSNEEIVTAIKGHPCLIFWSETGEQNSYQYIGKYNLNLDKATPEPFGFKHDDDDDSTFGWLVNEAGEYTDLEGNIVDKANRVNSIRCFEFLDNKVPVCNFIGGISTEVDENGEPIYSDATYEDTWYSIVKNKENKMVPGWTIGFESRHPEDIIDLHGADEWYRTASWINHLYLERQKGGDAEAAALQEFRDKYQEHFDKDFLLAYYVITNTLLMADSRVKNMMIATWGKEKRTFTLDNGATKEIFDWIWYPIFYDMDTMLGLDNEGKKVYKYYSEDSNTSVFNGDEVLWNLVRDALPLEVAQYHSRMEQGKAITVQNILDKFSSNQASMANESFYNEDAKYKYITPYRKGYIDDSTENKDLVKPGKATYMYAVQGDRTLDREDFVTNRVRYLSGRYETTNFIGNDRIVLRVFSPGEGDGDNAEEKAKIIASVEAVPPSGTFHLKSNKTGFAGIMIGANADKYVKRFEGEQKLSVTDPTFGAANATEGYIIGLNTLSSLGDLSDKYPSKFVIQEGSDIRLKEIILGNNKRDYYNPKWDAPGATLSIGTCKYLELFNLQNCNTYTGSLSLRGCPNLKYVYLEGSGVSSLSLPQNGVLEELRIPSTITTLDIDSHENLTAENFTIGYYDYDKELADDGTIQEYDKRRYQNVYTNLIHVSIKNTPIDSYELARQATFLAETSIFESYCFTGVDWTITESDDLVIENVDGKQKITGIKILDFLSTKAKPYAYDVTLVNHGLALTGNLTIDAGDYVINQFELYEKYNGIYPSLNIDYVSNELQRAARVEFYNTETVLGNPYYSVLASGSSTETLAYLASAEGPNKTPLTTPQKNSSDTQTFAFSGKWKVAECGSESNYKIGDIIYQTGGTGNDLTFENVIPNDNLKLVPIFNAFTRMYDIILLDYDGTELANEKLEYHDDIGVKLFEKGVTESYYNYRPYDNTNSGANPKRYEFAGWQNTYTHTNDPTTINYRTLDGVLLNDDIELYAYYEVKDCVAPFDNKYFTFTENVQIAIEGQDSITGTTIALADKYKEILTGQVILPLVHNSKEIVGIADQGFKLNKYITEVLFDQNGVNAYVSIGASAFELCDALKHIELPQSLLTIGDKAFDNCKKLEHSNLEENDALVFVGTNAFNQCGLLELSKLPETLQVIGGSAFAFCKKLTISDLPRDIRRLGSWCFASTKNTISTFGAPGATNVIEMEDNFVNAGVVNKNNGVTVVTINCPKEGIKPKAFASFGPDDGFESVVINNGATQAEVDVWGLKAKTYDGLVQP